MKYKIVTSGTSKEVTLDRLSRSLRPQSEIYTLSGGEVYLGVISHKTLVLLATEFADYALKNYAKRKIPEAEVCLSLTRKWIEDDSSVSKEELRTAAYAANAAANAANATTVHADDAAAAAADAAYAAVYTAAVRAANAAAYSAYAAGKDRDGEFIRQGEFILDFLKSGKNLFLV